MALDDDDRTVRTAQTVRLRTVDEAAIVQSALTLFARYGYRATTMTDIGAALGIKGPSLYKHVVSKQELLRVIMISTMTALLHAQHAALEAGGTFQVQVRRMIEAHVRFHAANRDQAFVGNREIDNLDESNRATILALRREYSQNLRQVIEAGVNAGEFGVASPRLAAYALLDMGIGTATWFRSGGGHSPEQLAFTYADFAVAMLHVN